MSIIVAPSAEKNRTSRTKRVYFKRNEEAELESIKFERREIKNNLGDPVTKAVFETDDKEIIEVFKAKNGYSVLNAEPTNKIDETNEATNNTSSTKGNDEGEELDREALLVQYEELFGQKPPGNILTATLAGKIAEKLENPE